MKGTQGSLENKENSSNFWIARTKDNKQRRKDVKLNKLF